MPLLFAWEKWLDNMLYITYNEGGEQIKMR